MNMKKLFAVLAVLLVACTLRAQSSPDTFTLSWQTNTSLNTTYSVHSLTVFDGQTPPSSVCGQDSSGGNVWCGQVHHYATGAYDFNFPSQQLSGCIITGSTSHTDYTAVNRRTVTETDSFSCTDANSVQWSVSTTTATYQYRAAQRYFYYWYNFNPGMQPAITGTLTQVAQ
jgi:hypothetical protein